MDDKIKNILWVMLITGSVVVGTYAMVDSKIAAATAATQAKIKEDKADIVLQIKSIDDRYTKRFDKVDDKLDRIDRRLSWRERRERRENGISAP